MALRCATPPAERFLDRRVLELGGVGVQRAGGHPGHTPHERARLERLREVGLAEMIGQHVAAGIRECQLRHGGGLADSHVALDQQDALKNFLPYGDNSHCYLFLWLICT